MPIHQYTLKTTFPEHWSASRVSNLVYVSHSPSFLNSIETIIGVAPPPYPIYIRPNFRLEPVPDLDRSNIFQHTVTRSMRFFRSDGLVQDNSICSHGRTIVPQVYFSSCYIYSSLCSLGSNLWYIELLVVYGSTCDMELLVIL